MLDQRQHIVRERREGRETATETCDKQRIHRRGNQRRAFGISKQHTDHKTTHHIYHEGPPGEYRGTERRTQAPRQESQAGTKKSARTRQKHHFYHIHNRRFLSVNAPTKLIPKRQISKSVGILFAPHRVHKVHNLKLSIMHLTPKEIDKLLLLSLGAIAERRKERGLKLNHPEAVAYITSAALEGAREGKTVEEVMTLAAGVLTRNDVMEGVADMIDLLQVEAVFTDGSRLVSIHKPIK